MSVFRAVALVSLLLASQMASQTATAADPGYYLVTVYENEGEASVDFRYWTVKFPGQPETRWPEIGFGYGVTKRWYTEVFASYIGSRNEGTHISTLNWQNDYLLTQGQYPFDLAVHTNLISFREPGAGYGLTVGPVFQTDVGRTQLNANVFFERGYDGSERSRTQMKYQWQAKYRWKPGLHFGMRGFGELGDWDDWKPGRKQSHRAGPMIAGAFPIGKTQAFEYQLAYLGGSIYGQRHGRMLSLRLQYLFY
jgi:hypothetical protein